MGDNVHSRRWTFSGRVLPERVAFTGNLPVINGASAELGINFKLDAHIAASQIVGTLVSHNTIANIYDLKNLMEDAIRSFVDVAGFLRGMSLDVEIISASSDDGRWHVFGSETPFLFDYNADSKLDIDAKFLVGILSDDATELMLSDFREAMRVPVQTGFFCYRAIEACMQSFAEREGLSEKAGWQAIRSNLNIDRGAISIVKAKADRARHGKRSSITDTERRVVLGITHEIIRRYLAFINSGYIPLPDNQYAKLTDAPAAVYQPSAASPGNVSRSQ